MGGRERSTDGDGRTPDDADPGVHRRTVLGGAAGLGIFGVAPFASGGRRETSADDPDSHVLRIEGDGEHRTDYRIVVDGTIERGPEADAADAIDGATVRGSVRGVDDYRYTGELSIVDVYGPATVTVDDAAVAVADLGENEGLESTMRLYGDGETVSTYRFSVRGSVERGPTSDGGAPLPGATVRGAVRGTDDFRYSGEVVEFESSGPLTAYVDGERVALDRLGYGGAWWPTDQYDPARTGYAPRARGPAGEGGERWRFDAGGGAGDGAGAATAVDESAGTGGVAVHADGVLVGSAAGHVYRVSRDRGIQAWRFDADAPVRGSPTVDDGDVFVGDDGGTAYALDAVDRSVRWRVDAGGPVRTAVAVADGRVIVATTDGGVVALDRWSGRVRWRAAAGGAVATPPAVGPDGVFVGTDDGLVALSPATGARRWRWGDGEAARGPTVAQGVVYAAVGGDLVALDAGTGTERWRVATGEGGGSPAVANGVVYAGGSSPTLRALRASDGSERWAFDGDGDGDAADSAGVRSAAAPVVAGERVYVGTGAGGVYGLNVRTGAVAFRAGVDEGVRSPSGVVDGVCYLRGDGGTAFALSSPGNP